MTATARLSMLATAGLALALGAAPAAAQQTRLTYFTGPTGGSWIPIGGALKSIWEKAIPGLAIENRPGAGLVNMKAIEEDKAQIGMGNMISTVDALKGIGQGITAPYKNVCHLASLYPQVQQIVVRADQGINTLADLKGKSVGTLPRGNTTEVVAGWIMEAAGVPYKDTAKMNFVSIADQANMFKDGQISASLIISTMPTGGIMDMANSRPIRLLDVPDDIYKVLVAKNAGFSRITLPKSTYPGMDRDNLTIQFSAHVIVSCKLPEQLVYDMAKAMTEALPELASVNSVFKGATVKDFGAKVGVPFHPGAERYFKERGAL
ncbi:MAG: TAXI family TRAP transporter solute-binding subunit [Acetobacteraceae bacterium]|nr:TAXI family TRAP transporter solute-binding subunit [Acetobacteraceae bacterium]